VQNNVPIRRLICPQNLTERQTAMETENTSKTADPATFPLLPPSYMVGPSEDTDRVEMPLASEKTGRVLVVDDDEDILTAAQLLLKQHVARVSTESRPDKALARLAAEHFDVIFLDMNFSRNATTGNEGFHWLKQILDQDPGVVVILITAFGDMEIAVRAIKMGATDFILKPWRNEKLLATLHAAFELRASRGEVCRLRATQQALTDSYGSAESRLIGQSAQFLKVMEMTDKVAASDAGVLLLGENGTGKELIARAIHQRSKRAAEPFIAVDMGAITETLFESELFGHVRGAFTDARQDKPGRFEIAHRGTLFLDEIGNLTLSQQAKLLTVLEQHSVTRVGSNVARSVDIRLICATNRPLRQMVTAGTFRIDLLYRIDTVEICIPPLRERPQDIAPLIEFYLGVFSQKYSKSNTCLAPDAMPALSAYSWPGNIRELKHAVERAVILAEGSLLRSRDFYLGGASESENGSVPTDTANLEQIERRVIERVLRRHNGNVSRASHELGLTRTALYRRMDKYGL
jgi:two-component system, NtrC family, response regulator HydG